MFTRNEDIELGARNASETEHVTIGGLAERSSNLPSPSKSDSGSKAESYAASLEKGDIKSSPIRPSRYSPIKVSPAKASTIRE